MSERPILFSGPMVRAILAGRKTQTRRPAGKRKPPAVGDVLWVRETWAEVDPVMAPPRVFAYRADEPDMAEIWRPSIFMPRAACRLKLLVTDVRQQRLQDISERDAVAEGVRCWICDGPVDGTSENYCSCFHSRATAVDSFKVLWNGINGKRANWASNPEVHAITFAPLEKP